MLGYRTDWKSKSEKNLMSWDKYSLTGKTKAKQDKKFTHHFPCGGAAFQPCPGQQGSIIWQWLGKTNTIALNIHPFLLPPALYAENDTLRSHSISIWIRLQSAWVSFLCHPSLLTRIRKGLNAQSALVSNSWNISVLSALLSAQVWGTATNSYCEDN